MVKDEFLEYVQQKLSALKLEMDSDLNSPEHEYQRLWGRYEAYEEVLNQYRNIRGIRIKPSVKYKWRCPECEMEILGDTQDAHYACGNCSCRPWDNDGKDIEMQFVGEVTDWNDEDK